MKKWRFTDQGETTRVQDFSPSFQLGVVIIFPVFCSLRLMDNLGSPRTIRWVFPSLLPVSSGVFVQSCCDLLTCWINKLFSHFLSSLSFPALCLSLNGPFNSTRALQWICTYRCKAWYWIITLPHAKCLALTILPFPTHIHKKFSRQQMVHDSGSCSWTTSLWESGSVW